MGTQNTGTLVLTANTGVTAGNDIVVTISVQNKASAQSAPTVNVVATIAAGNIASSAMTGTNMAVVAPAFATKTISASSQITGATNTLTITLNANVAIASGDVITISGITGTQTADNAALPLNGADKAKFTPSGTGASASTAGWTQNTGTLVLTANTAVNAGTDIVVTISVTNKASTQSAPTVNVVATIAAGNIASSAMTG